MSTHVTIRDVALRDGLQIEDPIPLEAKVELLAAIVATGVTEVEATAFVSPSKVPALADAAELAVELKRFGDVAFSALVASAGGASRALAAGLAQRAADRIVLQVLHQPVLDDRPSPSKEEFVDTPGFDGPAAELMWGHYLGADRPYDAVPAALADLTGLPPALITCSELDPLRDEAIDYALRLMWAGVATELHVFPGTCHGFDAFLPDWEVSRGLYGMQVAALRRVFYSEP